MEHCLTSEASVSLEELAGESLLTMVTLHPVLVARKSRQFDHMALNKEKRSQICARGGFISGESIMSVAKSGVNLWYLFKRENSPIVYF